MTLDSKSAPHSAPPFGTFERKIATRYLGAKKSDGGIGLIAGISFACIMLAIFAMITIMSIMNGFRETTVNLTLGADGHMYVITLSQQPEPGQLDALRDRLAAVEDVEVAFPFTQSETFVQSVSRNLGVMVVGIPPEEFRKIAVFKDNITAGDLDSFGQGENGGRNIVIGIRMANALGLNVGDPLTIYSTRLRTTAFGNTPIHKAYTVSAIFDTGLIKADSFSIYMPLDQAVLFFKDGRSPHEIQLRLTDPDLIHKLQGPIADAAHEPVYVETWEQKNPDLATALRTEQIAMRFIFMIVVLIAVFPILAAMIMLVKNKAKDIAILKTMGASSGSILRIFLMVGATIGFLGTLAGIILGLLFCFNIEYVQKAIEWIVSKASGTTYQLFPPEIYGIDHLPVKIVPAEIFWVSFWGFLVATLATFLPARTASKTDPVEALRYE